MGALAADKDAGAGEAPPSILRSAPSNVEFKKLRKRLLRQTQQALTDFAMVEPPKGVICQKWLVCLSGGKDSYAMLANLIELQWRGELPVEIVACNLDQAQPGFPAHILPDWLDGHGIVHRIERVDTYSVVMDKVPEGKTYCALCSRLRRGNLYRMAREEGCSAVVLGHHRDDILETFFMNLFHGGRVAAMPPKLLNDEGDLLVLRPLAYCAEEDIAKYAAAMHFPIIPCDLCGSQDGLQRNVTKQMLADLDSKYPGRKDTMIRAMANVRPSHMLDRKLFDFMGLEREAARPDGGATD
ncbi:MAG: tRNA 2-thiocytidine(32) synthetase TtcA [Pseudomonadota bacterium]